jgi:hypothetical protein
MQHPGYTLYIGLFETGRMVLTTSGTVQAIYFAKSFIMQPGQLAQHLIPVALLQHTLVSLLVLFGQ